jgi:hypothetical protein
VTPSQRLISCLIVAHLVAIFLGAIPGLDDFGADPVVRGPSEHVTPVTAAFDAAAARIVWLHRVTWALTAPLRPIVNQYLRLTSQFQVWNMFCNPAQSQRQVRIGYRLIAADGARHTEFQQVFPAGPPELKLVRAYFDSFTDKALAAGVENYRRLVRVADASNTPLSDDDVNADASPFHSLLREPANRCRPATRHPACGGRILVGDLADLVTWLGSRADPPARSGTTITWQLWMTDDLP